MRELTYVQAYISRERERENKKKHLGGHKSAGEEGRSLFLYPRERKRERKERERERQRERESESESESESERSSAKAIAREQRAAREIGTGTDGDRESDQATYPAKEPCNPRARKHGKPSRFRFRPYRPALLAKCDPKLRCP